MSPAGFRRGLERLLEAIVIVLLAGLTTLVVVAVAFRKGGAALAWYDEMASVLLAWVTYYGACLAALNQAHIGFPTLVEATPPAFRLPLLVIREVFVVGFFVIVAYAGWRVQGVLAGTSLVTLAWVPLQVTQSVIPIGAVLFIVAELVGLGDRLPVRQ